MFGIKYDFLKRVELNYDLLKGFDLNHVFKAFSIIDK